MHKSDLTCSRLCPGMSTHACYSVLACVSAAACGTARDDNTTSHLLHPYDMSAAAAAGGDLSSAVFGPQSACGTDAQLRIQHGEENVMSCGGAWRPACCEQLSCRTAVAASICCSGCCLPRYTSTSGGVVICGVGTRCIGAWCHAH
jgi:hypothetical protein